MLQQDQRGEIEVNTLILFSFLPNAGVCSERGGRRVLQPLSTEVAPLVRLRIIKPAPLMLMFIQSLSLPTSLLLVLSHVGDIRLRI